MPDPGGTDTPRDGADDGRDWASLATDRVVDVVDRIRSATTQPAITAARGVVYGLVALICSVAVLVLLVLGIFRLLDVVVPGESWSAHLVTGGLLCAAGGFLWSRRSSGRPGC